MPAWSWCLFAGGAALLPSRNRTAVRLRVVQTRGATNPARPRSDVRIRWHQLADGLSGPRRRTVILLVAVGADTLATILSQRPLVGLSFGLMAAVVASAVGRAQVGRSVRGRRRVMRSALRMLNAELVAGARESDALLAASLVGGTGDRFRRAAAVAGAGGDVTAVFAAPVLAGPGAVAADRRLRGSVMEHDFAPLAAAWHVRSRCGAALAELVGQVENDLIAADERWREVDAALAGPRSSAALLAGLPIVGVALGSAMGAHPLGWLLGTTPGAILLLVGLVFDAVGLLWMQRLVRSGFSGSGR